ncbi:hypothetical protein KJ885_02425 [Patescibacteria group bacterium]|nr:hypothetical protein [Patescibacteria group bacterium]
MKTLVIQNDTPVTLYADVTEKIDGNMVELDITIYSKEPTLYIGNSYTFPRGEQLILRSKLELAPFNLMNRTGHDLTVHEVTVDDAIGCIVEFAKSEAN